MTVTSELLSRRQIAKRYRRRPEWVEKNLPSVPDPENSRRRVYSVATIEAYFRRIGELEAERGAA